MAFLSSDSTMDFPYALADCFVAMKAAVATLPKFKVKSENETAGTIEINVSPGLTSFTFGDIVTANFSSNPDGTTKIKVTSTAKMASAMASIQQNKNIQVLVTAFSSEIQNYSKIVFVNDSEQEGIKKRLTSLDALRKDGLITDDEYDKKRAEILASL